MKHCSLFRVQPTARFLPHLEILEPRLQPGEGILGFLVFGFSLGDLGQNVEEKWEKPDSLLARISIASRQIARNDETFTGSSTSERDLVNNSPVLRLSDPTENSPAFSTTNRDDWTQNFATHPGDSPVLAGLSAGRAYGNFPSAQSSGPDWVRSPGSWNLNQHILTAPQTQLTQSTDLPQVFSINRATVQSDASGMTRILTTRATHLPNLHIVKHVPQTSKSQLRIQDTTLEFLTHFGGPGEDAGKGIVVDEKGNSYITGYYDTRDPNQGTDVFVAKLDPSGKNLVWFVTFGGPGRDEGHGIARDKQGNVYVTGTIDTGDPDRGTDAFVAKLDPDGNFIYQPLLIGGPGNDSGNGITVNDVGEAYITGAIAESGTSFNSLIAKIRAGGSDIVFAIEDVTLGNSHGNGIGLDAGGNIYVAGQDFNGPPHARVFKYYAEIESNPPTFAWAYRTNDSAASASANAIAVVPDGTYYWAGELSSFDGRVESILLKGGPGGVSNIIYFTGIGGARSRSFAVAYNARGEAYIAGLWESSPAGAFLWEFSPDGERLLNAINLLQGTVAAYGIVLDNAMPNPNAYMTGILDTRNPEQGIDAFVAKVSFH